MKPQLTSIFGYDLSSYLNASSEQVIYACQLPETHQAIDQLPRRHQVTVWRSACVSWIKE